MKRISFFSVALPQSHDSHWIDPNLQKGRGEDARDMYSTSTADEYHEDEYPTGEMTEPRHIGHRQGVNWDSDHLGIFGEKRHIFLSASKRRNATKVNWVHIKPGTKVEPHHVTQIFDGLHNAGYTKPMQWSALRDDDEHHRASGTSRRDRLFGSFAAQWDKYVAAKQAESAVPAPAPATHESETPETAEDWAETHSALLPSDQPGRMQKDRTMRKSFFDFGFFIDGALMKAPTPSGLSEEEHAALARRFPRAATPASPPAPATPEITEETHSGMSAERRARLEPKRREMMTEKLGKYREARPRQSPDEEGTRMRSVGVAMPSGVVQPMIIHKDEEGGVDERGRTPMRQYVDGTLGEESNEQAMNRIYTRKHVQNGTLTDGNEFMNLAGLAGHRANQIAAEYAKWRESGGGPRPDLSKYEDPVIRRKDGSTWDYRDAFKRMVDLDGRARKHDTQHGWLADTFGDSFAIDDPDHVHSIHPTRIWDRIHGMMQPKTGKDPFDYYSPSTGRNVRVERPALTISDLKRGLPISQQIPLVRELLNLGLDHQKMYRIHANQSESPVQKSGEGRGALMKAPTGSGLSEEEHAALARRFPRAATPASPPATPEITKDTHSGMTPERIAGLLPSQHDELGAQLDRYRAARPRQSRTGLRPHGADEEGTPMRSIAVRMPRGVSAQPMLIHKDEEAVGADGLTPMHRRWRQQMSAALEQESESKMHTRRCADNHAQYGTLTDGNEFMNLAGLAGHRANQIAAEYAKWRESGGGPRPDLSKYEDPVIRRKDGSTWDYRDAFKRMVDLDTRASRYDWRHGWLANTFGDSFAIDDPDHVHSIHPARIWDRIHGGFGLTGERQRPALTTSDLKRGLPLSQQIPFVRELLMLGLRHQQMSRTHANQSESPVQKSGEGRLSRLQWGHSIADVKTPNGLVEEKFEQPEGYRPLHGLGHRGHFGPGGMMKMIVLPADVDGNWHQDIHPPPSPDAIKHPYVKQFMLAHDAPRDPHTGDVLEMFHGLWDAGYHGMYMHYRPEDNRKGTGENLRRRLFRPYRVAWAHFTHDKREGRPIDGLYGLPPVPKSTLQAESAVQKSAAWQRKEGKNPKGGLNAKGRESAKREGHNLKPPVKSGDNPRRASFLARMGGSPGPEYDEHGEPTRLLLALRVWGASSKADAKKKASAMSERLKKKKLEKGRGDDARNEFSASSASGLSERDFPTGQMTEMTPLGTAHVGVFGEKRNIRVEASKPDPADSRSKTGAYTTHIDWVHVLPGTKVEPHHVQQIFGALHNAGYTKPMTWDAIRDDDEKFSSRPSRRERFFRPLADQWRKFVQAKQAKMTKAYIMSTWFRQDLLSKAYYAKKTNSVTGREETTGGGFYNAGLHHALMTNPDAFPENTLVKIDRHHPDHAHMFTEEGYPQYGIQSGDHIGNFDGFQIHVEKARPIKDRLFTNKAHGYISAVQRDMTLPQSHGVTFADIAPTFGEEAGKAGYQKLTFTPFKENFDASGSRRQRARQRLFGPHIDKINEQLESAMPLILSGKNITIPMRDKES